VSSDQLSIGAFSRAASISVKTLRTYHEMGLLVPASIDARTGYRTYTVDQLTDATVVTRLRSLEVPLAVVKQIVDARDPTATRRLLEQHQEVMRERLAEMTRIVTELHDHDVAIATTPVHLRRVEAVHTLRLVATVPGDDLAAWLARTHERMLAVAHAAGAVVSGPPGACYTPALESDEVERVEAFVPLSAPFVVPVGERDLGIGQGRAGTVAVLVHQGPFATIGDSYRALGAWVARHADGLEEPIVEHYVRSDLDTDDDAQHRTEICWPVA
jgi:DNA-binding transcriptional MerR regulator/effector-binding domain-containing protein